MKSFLTLIFLPLATMCFAQEDLLKMLEEDGKQKKEDVTATFKTTRLVSGQSLETNHGGVLNFVIQHRFGPVNSGAHEFFGLDQATIRLGLDMGITDRFTVGLGRSSFGKIYDGFIKYNILKQKIDGFPLTITGYNSMAIQTDPKDPHPEFPDYFSSRLYYVHQLLIGSRVTQDFSYQISPTLTHRNIVPTAGIAHDVFSIGIGARQKLTKRVSINAEYFYTLPGQLASDVKNPFSVGFDIETGGHVFQLHFTNARQMADKGLITETNLDWLDGGIHFGFNISRVFTLYQWNKGW